tara:strand:- start:1449 stop:2363 length:915 start_codon:yes stop_codon:yes gene_type:complete
MKKQVRNIVRTQFENAVKKAQREAENEGKKKMDELQNELPTPETILKKLEADINGDSCSNEGYEKYNKIVEKLEETLLEVNNKLNNVKENIDNIIEVIEPITEEIGPVETLNSIATVLKLTLIPTMELMIMAAMAQLVANSGPTSSGAATKMASDKLDKAKGKTADFKSILIFITFSIAYWKKRSKQILNTLEKPKSLISMIQAKIMEAVALLKYKELEYLEGCDALENADNLALQGDGDSYPFNNPYTDNSALEVHLGILEDKFNDVYNQLQSSGNTKYIERLYTLKQDLTEDYNISFKTKYF